MLKSIAVEKFRNLNKVKLNFSRNVNIIVGDNGQGKTNLLEAIYLLSYAKSFRANKSQIINWQADWARIAGLTDKDEIEIRLRRDQETRAFVNKKKKIGQYFIRIPKNFESLLNLHKGMEVKMVVKIPPRHKNELVKVSLEF